MNYISESKNELLNRRKLFVSVTVGIIILIFAAVVFWQCQVARGKTKEANANRLATIAEAKVNDDPTVALRIAEQAWRLDKNKTVTDTIYKIYRENVF